MSAHRFFARLDGNGFDPLDLTRCRMFRIGRLPTPWEVAEGSDPDPAVFYLTGDGRWVHEARADFLVEAHPLAATLMMFALGDRLPSELESYRRDAMRARALGATVWEELARRIALGQDGPDPSPAEVVEPASEPQDCVTLAQAAAIVKKSKRALEYYKSKNTLPAPIVEGGAGKAALYDWKNMRSWLTQEFGMSLPERFPSMCRRNA